MKKDEYVIMLSKASRTKDDELILQMLDEYGVCGIKDLTDAQVETFAKRTLTECI